ncbi:LysR family transcriptional regulator [Acinetobacter oleivorans]|uniref:LysR family transcriptional regulator n=1 Tax=Acinetobacter oleivorans TaxID=1148157 RepID=UPI001CD34F83|nr:LysR family transcriptional regulator [Acinetobacter oleivorans]
MIMDNLKVFFSSRLKLKDLRVIYLISQYGSITKVSETIHMTPAAVSKILVEIEKNYGSPLFTRDHKGLTPLPECLVLIDAYFKIEHSLKQTQDKIFNLRGVYTHEIRIGLQAQAPSIEKSLCQTIIRLKKTNPHLTINIDQGYLHDLLDKLRTNKLDLVIARTNINSLGQDLRGVILHKEDGVIIAHPKLDIPSNYKNIKQLLELPWCLPTNDSIRQSFDMALISRGLSQPKNLISSTSFSFIKSFFPDYPCLSIASKNLAQKLQNQGKIKIINCGLEMIIDPQAIIWSNKIPLSEEGLLFRDTLCYEITN